MKPVRLERADTAVATPGPGSRIRRVLLGVAPLAAVGVLALLLAAADPAALLDNGAPPAEDLTVERTVLDDEGIRLHVRNGGPDPVHVAQVIVDDAYWAFTATPEGPVQPLRSTMLQVPYPWVEGEAHEIMLITNTGATFVHEIEVAVASPAPGSFVMPGLVIGLLVGVAPVVAGMLWLPWLRRAGPRVRPVVLAFTVGLLAFLGADALFEAFEHAERAAGGLHADGLVVAAFTTAVLGILLVDRLLTPAAGSVGRAPASGALGLAYLVALAIGLHNLGEGLAIGGAYAAGEVALGATLFIGFAVHNVTEGPAIVAPLAERGRVAAFAHLAALAALAGLPTVGGAWLGALAAGPAWTALALGLGAGAAAVVVLQVWPHVRDPARGLAPPQLVGLLAGVAVMYATSLLAA